LEAQIQSYLRWAASRGRETERIGPFLATFTRHSNNRYLNYAIPDDGATPTAGDVRALISAYDQRERTPRLEYVPRLAPAVQGMLEAAGFLVEGRLPLMVCAAGSVHHLPVPDGFELVMPTSEDELHAVVAVQHEAYGESEPSPEDVGRLRRGLEDGGIAMLARESATREPAGAGICTAPGSETTEIAGIGVRAGFRRRGIAGALTVGLAQSAFEAGVSFAFLMAAHEAEARIYARAGFSPVGEILHISRMGEGA
jgi:ribosomal protein S18 acetylase RimI-like enzyme